MTSTTHTDHVSSGVADDHAARRPPPARRRRFTVPELTFLVGVPVLWAVLLLFHPSGDGKQVYLDLQDTLTRWFVVHMGMVIFIPLMALVVAVLLRGVEGTAARVSRIALVLFAVFYSAWETLYGIGNGILAHEVNGLPPAERARGAELVQDFGDNVLIRGGLGVFVVIGSLALVIAMIAAGSALRNRAGAPLVVPVLLGLSAFLITAHPPPFGPAGLVLFVVAVLILWRSQPGTESASHVSA
jgi:hypothetical protein